MIRTKSRRTLHDLGVSAQYQRDASVASAVHSTHGFAEERIDHRAENHREHAVVVREAVQISTLRSNPLLIYCSAELRSLSFLLIISFTSS